METTIAITETIPEFLEKISRNWSSRPAVTDSSNNFSYKEFCSRIGRKRGYINSLCLEKGSRVAVIDRTSIDALEMFLAISTSGLSAIMLPADSEVSVNYDRVKVLGAKAVAVGQDIKTSADFFSSEGLKVFFTNDSSDREIPPTTVSPETEAAVFLVPGDAPKGAILSHKAIVTGAYNACFTPEPVHGICKVLCTSPLHHVFGMISTTLSTLYQGGQWVCCKDLKETISKMESIKPTKLFMVPGLCEIILAKIRMYGIEKFAAALDTVVCCESKLSQTSIDEFEKYRIRVVSAYGSTETAGIITVNSELPAHHSSAGQAIPGQELKIQDEEILFCGTAMFSGYAGKETESRLTEDGWFRTGDKGSIDEEGRLTIYGRKKNLIVLSSGDKIDPSGIRKLFVPFSDEIQNCEIKEDTFNGENIILAVLSTTADEARIKEIIGMVNMNLPSGRRIMKYVIQ